MYILRELLPKMELVMMFSWSTVVLCFFQTNERKAKRKEYERNNLNIQVDLLHSKYARIPFEQSRCLSAINWIESNAMNMHSNKGTNESLCELAVEFDTHAHGHFHFLLGHTYDRSPISLYFEKCQISRDWLSARSLGFHLSFSR